MLAEIWREVGESMRRLRQASGYSLREIEDRSGWGRGTLSQMENGKARPSREVVEWYDASLMADGLLLSMYFEAHLARADHREPDAVPPGVEPVSGDSVTCAAVAPPAGSLVAANTAVQVQWTLTNTGSVPWRGRLLRRVGAHAGVRAIGSTVLTPIPDTEPGSVVEVGCALLAPKMPGTAVAYWQMVDPNGMLCFPGSNLMSVLLVVA